MGTKLTIGQRAADAVAAAMGSWNFLIWQTAILVIYVIGNTTGLVHFDPYPLIFLNLILSFQAAYATPILMMANNRQAEIDRSNAAKDFAINIKSEYEVAALNKQIIFLHQKIDMLIGSYENIEKPKQGE